MHILDVICGDEWEINSSIPGLGYRERNSNPLFVMLETWKF